MLAWLPRSVFSVNSSVYATIETSLRALLSVFASPPQEEAQRSHRVQQTQADTMEGSGPHAETLASPPPQLSQGPRECELTRVKLAHRAWQLGSG